MLLIPTSRRVPTGIPANGLKKRGGKVLILQGSRNPYMARREWVFNVEDEDMHHKIRSQIGFAGFEIDSSETTKQELSAFRVFDKTENGGKKTRVNLLATRKCKDRKLITIELRSDEPHLRSNNYCEQSYNELMKYLPEAGSKA